MKKILTFVTLAAALIVTAATSARAQATQDTGSVFIDINVGAQTQSREFESSTSFPLYGETAIINTGQAVNGGALFDISGGYRFSPMLGAAIGFSFFGDEGSGSLAASIPSPIAFNRAVSVTSTADNLERSEVGTHLMLVYFRPIMENVEVSVFAGPSIFRVSQDLVSGSVPAGTQNLNVETRSEKATGIGGNIGLNINYTIAPNYGAGVFLRYAGGSVDLDSAEDLKVGGFQIGIGLRARF